MSQNKGQLLNFLEFLANSKGLTGYSSKIPKSELIGKLAQFLEESKIKGDTDLVFEEWEKPLRKRSRLIQGRYYIHYNIYTEVLTIELLPTVSGLERMVEIYSSNLKDALIKTIENLNYKEFPRLLENLFSNVPWAECVRITKLTRDGGIDFRGKYKDKETAQRRELVGQAKHWKTKVGPEPVTNFVGAITLEPKKPPPIGVYVCTAGFSQEAQKVIKKSPYRILAFDVNDLADLMLRHNIGLKRLNVKGKIIDERFWDEIRD